MNGFSAACYAPTAFEVFSKVIQDAGFGCRTSDKGFYAQDTIRKFGGLAQTAAFLLEPRKRALMEKYLDTTRPKEDVFDDGVYLSSDQRRYLDLVSIRKILGGDVAEATTLVDDLVTNGVLRRGFIFRCTFCRTADWFLIDEVGQAFTCKRCHRLQTYTRRHWLYPEEPRWYYKLDEIIYQGLRNDMLVPLLALDCLRRRAPRGFDYTNELEIGEENAEKPFLEIDICCIVHRVLCIGEAKRKKRLASKVADENRIIAKYHELTLKLGVRRVVFATTASDWSVKSKERIERGFAGVACEITLLNEADLFSLTSS